MLKVLYRWLVVAWAAFYAAWVTLGREAHRVLVGGYTRGDPRHPVQTRIRIAALEHELLPGNLGHAPEVCEECDPHRRYMTSLSAWVPAGAWYCQNCYDWGAGNSTLRSHWVQTNHLDYDVYDRNQDAQTKSNREKYPENRYHWKKDYEGPREHFRWGSARGG